MSHDFSLIQETPERKESIFLPSFPVKSNLLSRHIKKRSMIKTITKSKTILSPEDVKLLCEKIETKKKNAMPQLVNPKLIKNPIKLKNFRFNRIAIPLSNGHSPMPIKPVYFSKIFTRRNREHISEPYKFMLTGANFNYLNSRILENDSSIHSIQDISNLDARYAKHISPEPKSYDSYSIYYRTSNSFMEKDYNKRRVVFKTINLKK